MCILIQDVVFIDPPWGGPDYKIKDECTLLLDNVNVLDIINNLYHFTRFVALKAPNNFDTKKISSNFWYNKSYTIFTNKKHNYRLIIFYKKDS